MITFYGSAQASPLASRHKTNFERALSSDGAFFVGMELFDEDL